MAELTIRPLNCGSIHTDYSNMVYWTNFGTKISIPSFVYLIEGAKEKIVVDTSFLDPERGGAPWPASRTPDQDVKVQIESAGWKCEEVDILILSHLHWDHSQNCNLFPNAVKYVWAPRSSSTRSARSASRRSPTTHPSARTRDGPPLPSRGSFSSPYGRTRPRSFPG